MNIYNIAAMKPLIKIKRNAKVKTWGLAAALALVSFSSCDPLGIEPTTVVAEDIFWTNPLLTRAYINNFYLWMPATATDRFTSEQWSDNAIGNVSTDWRDWNQTAFVKRTYDALNGAAGFSAPWSDKYKNIRAVNIGIERISSSDALNEEQKNTYLGECYFFRAWLYFELEQYWGTVPYVDRVLDITDDTMIPRTSREKLFDYMLGDLTTSVDHFTKAGTKPQRGLVGLNAANTLKSRIALYAACAASASQQGIYDKLQGSNETKALFKFTKSPESYYTIALNAAEQVLGKYSLDSKGYSHLFNANDSHMSEETIWPVMYKKDARDGFNPYRNIPEGYYYGQRNKETSLEWGTRGGTFPTQDLVDCYYQKDKADGKWKQWWKTQQAKTTMGGTTDAENNFSATTENIGEMYKDRDSRFYTTILYNGSYLGTEEEMHLVQTWIDNSDPINTLKYSALNTGYRYIESINTNPTGKGSETSITGYYSCKYVQPKWNDNGSFNSEQPTTCVHMLRYAEVLLNYAEAAIKLNKEDLALPKINDIRNRAGLDNFDATVVGHNLWEEYKLQRRLEFAFEVPGQRYYDILRWSEAEGKTTIDELNRGPKAIRIFMKGIESQKLAEGMGYPMPVLDAQGQPNAKYFTPKIQTVRFTYTDYAKKFDNAKFYFMPFSETLLTSYKGFVQNPGW